MIIVICKHLFPKNFIGLTIFPFVFLKDEKLRMDKVFLNHEKIHLRQQLELLIIFFFLWYFIEFLLKYLKYKDFHLAYRNIIFEREAYKNEKNLHYLKQRPLWNFCKKCPT